MVIVGKDTPAGVDHVDWFDEMFAFAIAHGVGNPPSPPDYALDVKADY